MRVVVTQPMNEESLKRVRVRVQECRQVAKTTRSMKTSEQRRRKSKVNVRQLSPGPGGNLVHRHSRIADAAVLTPEKPWLDGRRGVAPPHGAVPGSTQRNSFPSSALFSVSRKGEGLCKGGPRTRGEIVVEANVGPLGVEVRLGSGWMVTMGVAVTMDTAFGQSACRFSMRRVLLLLSLVARWDAWFLW